MSKSIVSEWTTGLDINVSKKMINIDFTITPDNANAEKINKDHSTEQIMTDIIGTVELNNLSLDFEDAEIDYTYEGGPISVTIDVPIENEDDDISVGFTVGEIYVNVDDGEKVIIMRTTDMVKSMATIDYIELDVLKSIAKSNKLGKIDLDIFKQLIGFDEDNLSRRQREFIKKHDIEWQVYTRSLNDLVEDVDGYNFMRDFRNANVELKDVKVLAKKLLKFLSHSGTNQLIDIVKEILWTRSESFFVQFEKKVDSQFNNVEDIDNIKPINFTIIETLVDPCKALHLVNYVPPKLEEASQINSKVVEYVFDEEYKQFIIKYYAETKEAKIEEITCVKGSNKKCKDFQNNDNDMVIEGHWDSKQIEIDLVYMGSAKGSGHCTHAVGYMLKVLLREAAKQQQFPYVGKVHVASKTFCPAVNCYTKAFMINGFTPMESELEEFRNKSIKRKDELLDFTFKDFFSESQKKKMKIHKSLLLQKRRRAENEEYKMHLKEDIQNYRRITRSQSKSIAKRTKLRRRRKVKQLLKKKKEKVDYQPKLKF